jgi:hypothetical protein
LQRNYPSAFGVYLIFLRYKILIFLISVLHENLNCSEALEDQDILDLTEIMRQSLPGATQVDFENNQ